MFEVKCRKRARRNPRTGEAVDVEPKNVVTFKPGKEMEEKVRNMPLVAEELDHDDELDDEDGLEGGSVATKAARTRRMYPHHR